MNIVEQKIYYLNIASSHICLSIEDCELLHFISKEYSLKKSKNVNSIDRFIEVVNIGSNLSYTLRSKQGRKMFTMDIPVQSSLYFKEFLLQEFVELSLAERNILLIHGSCFFKKNRLFAFIGPSGSGKTTIIQLLKAKNLISNDTIIIQNRKNNIFIHTSPFDKRSGVSTIQKVFTSQVTIFTIEQKKVNRVTELPIQDRFKALQNNLDFLILSSQINISASCFLEKHYKKVHKNMLALVRFAVIKKLAFNKQLTPEIFSTYI